MKWNSNVLIFVFISTLSSSGTLLQKPTENKVRELYKFISIFVCYMTKKDRLKLNNPLGFTYKW